VTVPGPAAAWHTRGLLLIGLALAVLAAPARRRETPAAAGETPSGTEPAGPPASPDGDRPGSAATQQSRR